MQCGVFESSQRVHVDLELKTQEKNLKIFVVWSRFLIDELMTFEVVKIFEYKRDHRPSNETIENKFQHLKLKHSTRQRAQVYFLFY